MDVADIWFIAEQPERLTKSVVMGGHRGFIVHFDWTESQEVVGVGGRRGRGEVDYSRSPLSLRTI